MIGRREKVRERIGPAECAREREAYSLAWKKMAAVPIPPVYSGHIFYGTPWFICTSLPIQGFSMNWTSIHEVTAALLRVAS